MRVSEGGGGGVLEKVREEWCQCLIRPGLYGTKVREIGNARN